MTEETKVNKSSSPHSMALISIVLGVVGLFIFGAPLGLAGVFVGYGSARLGSKLGYVGLIFGIIVFLLTIISTFFN